MKGMPESSGKISLNDIAKAAMVSKATVSYVLRNQAGPSKETRERVLQIAQQLGYSPDARMVAWMAKVRETTVKDLVPVAWLDTNWEKNSWEHYQFLRPYLEGARVRARQLGYRIEMIWAGEPGMTMKRVSQIVYQRGIEGVIITHPARHIHLNWETLACVSLEGALLAPRLHRVMTDMTFNLLLALKMLRRFGYRRIGICFDRKVGRNSYNTCRAAIYYFHATVPKEEFIPPLFYRRGKDNIYANEVTDDFVKWVRKMQPDVVVGHDGGLLKMAASAGLRVPEDIGVVHIATDDDVNDWAGVNSKRREIGAAAVGWLIARLQNREFGVPETAVSLGIRGAWHSGRTLLVPKPK